MANGWLRMIPSAIEPSAIQPSSVANLHRQSGLRSGKTRDRHPVRRRADVVEADLFEEVDRRGIAAMLAADPELQILPRLPSELDPRLHHLADAFDVDRRKRIPLEDLLLLIDPQEL